jgi:hypothetical protein
MTHVLLCFASAASAGLELDRRSAVLATTRARALNHVESTD